MLDHETLDHHITWAEDERTELAKQDTDNPARAAIDHAHVDKQKPALSILQRGREFGQALSTTIRRIAKATLSSRPTVRFDTSPSVCTFNCDQEPVYVTYDSGADGHYVSEDDRERARLPILRPSTKRVGVANGSTSEGKHRTALPFDKLSNKANEADSFDDFPQSLMSVGRVADDDAVSIFTKQGVVAYKEEDVLITCKGEPILVGVRDERGRYRVPLVQHRGQWRPRAPTKGVRAALERANSVYDLPSVEQGVKWMHAVCGYPVKSTWLKAIKAGNFQGWPLLNERNANKYYPDTAETPKGHLNQARKNVRSTKMRAQPFQESKDSRLRGKKERDVYTTVYDVRETLFSDQTGQFPKRSLSGNRYLMVTVDIDSSAILVEPIKSRSDEELTRAYRSIMRRLNRANVFPKKHVMDNEVSEKMKNMIRDEFKMQLELVPPGCHRRNAAEVAIRNFKAHFLSILAGVADDFPPNLWDRLLPQAEITINLLRQSNATPTVSAYAHLNGPFDYNKMPLAPMGCKVQVHEKTDKRGTWSFHSVDGWYLATSPEHYRTHRCHIKSTRSERLSDTVHFHHKGITNPSLTEADKLMKAVADCSAALKGINSAAPTEQSRDLARLLDATSNRLASSPDLVPEPVRPTPSGPPVDVPRVPGENQRITRSQSARLELPSEPAMPAQPVPRVAPSQAMPNPTSRRRRKRMHQTPAPDTTAMSTRARQQAKARKDQPPATRTRSKTSKLSKLEREVHHALAVLDRRTGRLLKYRQLLNHPDYRHDWTRSSANEFGRLANGVGGRIKGTNTIEFVTLHSIPRERRRDVTYGQFVCTVRPEKAEPNRTRLVVGGDRINYPGEVGTPTAEMLVAKLLFNSTISTKGARFMTMDISNFYLMTPLDRPEYIRMKMNDIPDEIIDEYKLRDKADRNDCVYLKAIRGMYGLPHGGLIANQLLEKRLNKHGYFQSKLVPGLWTHKTRPIQFSLVVDDFGVKYVGEEHAKHLENVLKEHYKVTCDWTGGRYIGIHLDWDYNNRRAHLSMPGYVDKALKQFGHKKPTKPQDSPFRCAPINYGSKKQYAKQDSKAPLLDKKGKKFVQQVCGKLLFLGRAVDSTLLCPISAIAAQAATPTTDTLEQTIQLLDYLASQEEAVLTYRASDMQLAAHSDASYLSEPKARSRAGGHFFLSDGTDKAPNNGAVLNIAHIIKHVMASATEAELAALYIMAREAVYIRIILEELGHKQAATPLQTDNAAAEKVANKKVQPKRTKAMDMRFHWLRDRECQEQFKIHWRPGKLNYADYWTKHHPDKVHREVRRQFLTPMLVLEMLRLQRHNQVAAKAA